MGRARNGSAACRAHNVRAAWHKDPPNGPEPGVYVIFEMDCEYAKTTTRMVMVTLHQAEAEGFLVVRHETTYMGKH